MRDVDTAKDQRGAKRFHDRHRHPALARLRTTLGQAEDMAGREPSLPLEVANRPGGAARAIDLLVVTLQRDIAEFEAAHEAEKVNWLSAQLTTANRRNREHGWGQR